MLIADSTKARNEILSNYPMEESAKSIGSFQSIAATLPLPAPVARPSPEHCLPPGTSVA